MEKELKETTVRLKSDDGILFSIEIKDNQYSGLNEGLRASFDELIAIHDLIENMVI